MNASCSRRAPRCDIETAAVRNVHRHRDGTHVAAGEQASTATQEAVLEDAMTRRPRGYERAFLATLISIVLSACGERGAPSFALVGAYFPAWMVCALIGIIAAIGARGGFIASGLSGVLPFQLFVCASIGVCFALLAWLLWFGQ
jgi:hypothetical protein